MPASTVPTSPVPSGAPTTRSLAGTPASPTSPGGTTNSIVLPEPEIALSQIVVNMPFQQKITLRNSGKVPAGVFVDASAAAYATLSETQSQVTFKQYTLQEMLAAFSSFGGEATQGAQPSGQDEQNESTDVMTRISQKYNLPVFRSAVNDDYTLFTKHAMNNANLNEIFGSQMQKQVSDNTSGCEAGKVLYAHIPVGGSCVINVNFSVTQIVKNDTQKVYFWILGQQYKNMCTENYDVTSNLLKF